MSKSEPDWFLLKWIHQINSQQNIGDAKMFEFEIKKEISTPEFLEVEKIKAVAELHVANDGYLQLKINGHIVCQIAPGAGRIDTDFLSVRDGHFNAGTLK